MPPIFECTMSTVAAKDVAKEAKAVAKAAAKEAKAVAKEAKAATDEILLKKVQVTKEITRPVIASDITFFSAKACRATNDAMNKNRERVLECSLNPEFTTDPEYGESWKRLSEVFNNFLKKLCDKPYTAISMKRKGGRGCHYDADIIYSDESGNTVATEKLEFKYGASTIDNIPQFLSLQAHNQTVITGPSYDGYYYDNFIDKYIGTDDGITEEKPPREQYLTLVRGTTYDVHPFFAQIKARENTNKAAKNKVVNDSIKAYLESHIHLVNIPSLIAKFRESQNGKHFALWFNSAFHYDRITDAEMSDLQDPVIRCNNTIVLRAGNVCIYKLLLRWRNHKGILNPAWQISMKRCTAP